MEGEGVEKRGHVTTGLDGAEKRGEHPGAQYGQLRGWEEGKSVHVCVSVCVRAQRVCPRARGGGEAGFGRLCAFQYTSDICIAPQP